MKSRFLLLLIFAGPLFLCSAQEKGEMPVLLHGASEYRNYKDEPFALIDNYLDYYRDFSGLPAETQKEHILYFYKYNVDPVQIVAVLNLTHDDVKFAFIGEIMEGMHISTSGGCAGCFGDGTMGERDPYVQYEYEQKDPQRYANNNNLHWNIVDNVIFIVTEDDFLPTRIDDSPHFYTNGMGVGFDADWATFSSPHMQGIRNARNYPPEVILDNLLRGIDALSSAEKIKGIIKKEYVPFLFEAAEQYDDAAILKEIYLAIVFTDEQSASKVMDHYFYVTDFSDKEAVAAALLDIQAGYGYRYSEYRKHIDPVLYSSVLDDYIRLDNTDSEIWKDAFEELCSSPDPEFYQSCRSFLSSKYAYRIEASADFLAEYATPRQRWLLADIFHEYMNEASIILMGLLGRQSDAGNIQSLIKPDEFLSWSERNHQQILKDAAAKIEIRTSLSDPDDTVIISGMDTWEDWILDEDDIYRYHTVRMFDNDDTTVYAGSIRYKNSISFDLGGYVKIDSIEFEIPDEKYLPYVSYNHSVWIPDMAMLEIDDSSGEIRLFYNWEISTVREGRKIIINFPQEVLASAFELTFPKGGNTGLMAFSEMNFLYKNSRRQINVSMLEQMEYTEQKKEMDIISRLPGIWSYMPPAAEGYPSGSYSFFPDGRTYTQRGRQAADWVYEDNNIVFADEKKNLVTLSNTENPRLNIVTQDDNLSRQSTEPSDEYNFGW